MSTKAYHDQCDLSAHVEVAHGQFDFMFSPYSKFNFHLSFHMQFDVMIKI